MTSEERIRELLEDTERIDPENERFFEENYEQIQEEHGGEVVAVVDQEVAGTIGYDEDVEAYERFFEEIEQEYGPEKADRKLLRYVRGPEEDVLMPAPVQ
ncbi:MAG: hypothetical protein SVS85_03900 [Candidatus Nanohaloarchaea archaeon]|nr:hypothetical protein [Candidatus Nanohaloarchaea archaeon]